MRVLVDTNILIPLEDPDNFTDQLATLSRLVSGKHALLYHPGSCEDLQQDKDEARRAMMLQRLGKYNALEHPPVLSDAEEQDLFGPPRKRNDCVDNLILYALHRKCVHWLITEDQGLHKKARNIDESERVLRVEQAIVALRALDNNASRLHPHLDDIPCHAIDLTNTFFDSLREGYAGFNQWFNDTCCRDGRKAWICQDEGAIHSICIYKQEQDEVVTTEGLQFSGKSLKLCTFKVQAQGYKLGELMLKQAFNFATQNRIEHVYATVEPDAHSFLEGLLVDFGFEQVGTDTAGRDQVYVKYFPSALPDTSDTNLEYAIKYYPSFRLKENTAYLVPIQPQYHRVLFPEIQRQDDLFVSISNSAGNSIKQAYLCKANCRSIEPGDVLFFYRTHDEMAITTYGIVDKFLIETDAEQIYQWVAKRTVYSYDEIERMAGRQVKVILFRIIGHLEQPLTYQQLKSLGIVTGPIQSITSLTHDKAITIIREASINDCLISD
jgi:hypothetical protein